MAAEVKEHDGTSQREAPESETQREKQKAPQAGPRKYEIVYFNVLTFSYWHLAGLYGLYLCFTSAKWQTVVFAFVTYNLAVFGVTAGLHRLWSHRSYKAKLPLQIILLVLSSIGYQNAVVDWVRDHRAHHKYSDTDADPHNASRGLFYSHIGWLLVKKHPEVIKKGKTIDLSDINDNKVLRFQKRYALLLMLTMVFALPTLIPMYFWNETLSNAWHIAILRYAVNLNNTFLINSAAHAFGYKTYDKSILPAQNIPLSILSHGEGFHNYHHVYPCDYRTAELGNNKLNLTARFIDFFAWVGWAYDLKTTSEEAVISRAMKTGDGTDLWGKRDRNRMERDREAEEILARKQE